MHASEGRLIGRNHRSEPSHRSFRRWFPADVRDCGPSALRNIPTHPEKFHPSWFCTNMTSASVPHRRIPGNTAGCWIGQLNAVRPNASQEDAFMAKTLAWKTGVFGGYCATTSATKASRSSTCTAVSATDSQPRARSRRCSTQGTVRNSPSHEVLAQGLGQWQEDHVMIQSSARWRQR